jgi:phage minor structural protein
MKTKLWVLDREEVLRTVLSNVGPSPLLSAVHREQLNGEHTLSFEIAADNEDAQYVEEEGIVVRQDDDGNYDEFVIREIEDENGEGLTKLVLCEHSYTELIDHPVRDIRPQDRDAGYILNQILNGSRWKVGTVSVSGTVTTTFYGTNALDCIQQLAEMFDAELKFRVEFSGNQVTDRFVDFLARRGNDTGKRFEYGKDIKGIKRKINSKDVVTALIGRGKGEESTDSNGNPTGGYGRKITFEDVEWSVANGDPVDKPLGQDWVGDPDALQQFGRKSGTSKVHRTRFIDFEEETDPAKLLQLTWDALQNVKVPPVTYEMEVLDLEKLSGLEHEAVRIGDTVLVVDRTFSPELRVYARVIEIERNLLDPTDTKVVLGNFVPVFGEKEKLYDVETRLKEQADRLNDALQPGDPIQTSWLQGEIDTLNNELKGGGGKTTWTNDRIEILDKPPDENPGSSILLVDGKVAVSNEKQNGEFVYRNAITGDGIVADEIKVGYFRWERGQGGVILLGGAQDGNGQLTVLDENGEVVADLSAARGGFDTLRVGQLYSPSVVQVLQEDVDFYVDPINGDDDLNDGLSTTSPFKSIQKAIDVCPKNLRGYCRIYVLNTTGAALDFPEYVYIYGYFGNGNLEIYFPEEMNMTMQGGILIEDCFTRIKIYNAKVNYRDTEQRGVLWALNSQIIELHKCILYGGGVIDGTTGAIYNVYSYCSYVELNDSEFYGATTACVFSGYGSRVDIVNCKGKSKYGLWASRSGHIGGYDQATAPAGQDSTKNTRTTGGGVCFTGFTSFDPGAGGDGSGGTSAPPPATSIKTVVYNANNAASWRDTYGWRNDNNYVYQGNGSRWGSSGTHKGFWFFPSAMSSEIKGKTIKRIRFYCERRNSGGLAGSVTVGFNFHKYSSESSARNDSSPNLYGPTQERSFSWGQGKWIDLPSSWYSSFSSGTAKGIGIEAPSTNSDYYAIFQSAAKIEITYE